MGGEPTTEQATPLLDGSPAGRAVATPDSGEILNTLGHDVRPQLAALLERARDLLNTRLDAQQRDMVEDIRYSADALLALVSDVVDVSCLDSGALHLSPAPVDLHRLVDSSVALVRPRAAEKGLALTTSITPGVPRQIRADADRLRQVLWNLLSNAVKYTDHGSVTVEVGGRTEGPVWHLQIDVTDTGRGIPETMRDRLFQPTARAAGASTGLGLVICRKIADLWGGSITADHLAEGGTRFRVDLPCEAEEETIALRVLVAEDNPVNQKVIAGLLARHGHKAKVVPDGLQAVDTLRREMFDAVLMDMEMPVMDGL
jgi:signal transduction histidine kinase